MPFFTSSTLFLGGIAFLVLTALISGALTWHAHRQTKTAIYYFQMQRAERRLEELRSFTTWLVVLIAITGGYFWLDRRLNPVAPIAAAADVPAPIAETADAPLAATPAAAPDATPTRLALAVPRQVLAPTAPAPTLPQAYNTLTAQVPIGDETTITPLQFSQAIDDAYRPIQPATTFAAETDTLYATFLYDGMADGLAWSWLWRRDGAVVEGGHELWAYGEDGPGYMYISPPDGLPPGRYSAEIWINGTLFQQAHAVVGGDARVADIGAFPPLAALSALDALSAATERDDRPTPAPRPSALPTRPAPRLVVSSLRRAQPRNASVTLPADLQRYTAVAALTDESAVEIVRLYADYWPDSAESAPNNSAFALSATLYPSAVDTGMTWAWVWRYEDSVIGGGTDIWENDSDTFHFLHYSVPPPFRPGVYTLDIWFNNTLLAQATVDIALDGD